MILSIRQIGARVRARASARTARARARARACARLLLLQTAAYCSILQYSAVSFSILQSAATVQRARVRAPVLTPQQFHFTTTLFYFNIGDSNTSDVKNLLIPPVGNATAPQGAAHNHFEWGRALQGGYA